MIILKEISIKEGIYGREDGADRMNVILCDRTPDDGWTFKSDLERVTGEAFKCIYVNSSKLQGKVTTLFRYVSYFIVPLYGVLHKKEIDTIIAWQQFYGLLYAFWARLFHLKKTCKLVVMTFIYKEKKGVVGKVYKYLIHYIVTSEYIDKFVCFSNTECQKYAEEFGIPTNKFISSNLTVEDCWSKYKDEIESGSYYLSAGRSNRNYKFLCDVFSKMPDNQLVIICDRIDIANVPSNVTILNNVYGNQYFSYLAKAKAVILPLYNDIISAGQLVLLQSMMFGKVCIVTETETMHEYVKNGYNALFMNNNLEQVINIINRFERGEYAVIAEQARNEYLEKYSGTHIAEVVSKVLYENDR